MVDVFISYKSERRKAAAHLAKILECYGYMVWYDYSLVKGRDFAAQIDAKIREAKAVIVLWCSLSVRTEWVADEAALAAKLDTLVPVKIEPCDLRVDFDRKDYLDLTRWDGAPRDQSLDVLFAALEQKVGRAPQLNFKAISEYEEVWRRFGAPSLRAFALNAPVHADLESRADFDPSNFQQPCSPADRDSGHARKLRSEYWNVTPNAWLLAGALIAAVAGVLVWQILRYGEQGRRAIAPPTPPEPKETQTVMVEPPKPVRAVPPTPPEPKDRAAPLPPPERKPMSAARHWSSVPYDD